MRQETNNSFKNVCRPTMWHVFKLDLPTYLLAFLSLTIMLSLRASVVLLTCLAWKNDSVFIEESNESETSESDDKLCNEYAKNLICESFACFIPDVNCASFQAISQSDERYVRTYTESNGFLQRDYPAKIQLELSTMPSCPKRISVTYCVGLMI